MDLYAPVVCGTHAGTPCATTPAGDQYELATDGSYAHGQLLNQYTTENWKRPGADHNANCDGNCVPRTVDGNPLAFGAGQLVTASPTDCLEGPLMGVQFQQGFSTVDGDYGFGDGCFGPGGYDTAIQACTDGTEPTALTPDDYIVDVGIPTTRAANCSTRPPGKRTSTSVTVTRPCRRSRRRRASEPCTPSTSPGWGPTATALSRRPRASPSRRRTRPTTRPSWTSAAPSTKAGRRRSATRSWST